MEVEERDKLLLQISKDVTELRTVVLGTNGFHGMQGIIETMGLELGEAKNAIVTFNQKLLSYQTVDGCLGIHADMEKRAESRALTKERKKMTRREWIAIVIALMSVATAIIALAK